MRECLDEGILQSYFDGELSHDQMESATSHLASCSVCSATARELEGELNLVSTALAHEFDAAVPSERLRERIDAAVAGAQLASRARSEARSSSVRSWLQSLSAFTPQRSFGYAALVAVVLFAAIFGLIQWRQTPPSQVAVNVAETGPPGNSAVKQVNGSGNNPALVAKAENPPEIPQVASGPVTRRVRPLRHRVADVNQTVAQVKLLPGERSYLKTIAALDSTIKGNGSRPMTPALQAEYERNLALVDRALAATRSAAKKNPNDPEAAEFMFTAYQSKVNLLNTVADARLYNRQQ